jgi:hypothetical protein
MGIFLLKSKNPEALSKFFHCYVNLVKLLFDDVKIINLLTKLLILGMKIYFQFNVKGDWSWFFDVVSLKLSGNR